MSESKAKGLTLATIKNSTRVVSIDLREFGFEGVEDPLSVTFRTNFWTAKAQLDYYAEGANVADSDTALILSACTGWDFTDDGKEVPITDTFLREQLGFPVVHALVQAMIEAVTPNPKTSGS